MSTDYKVPYTKILDINPHPNADRLSIYTVYGFQIVAQKDKYTVGEQIIFVPVDSILPVELEAKLFPEGSKIKLSQHRVRQIRIRSFPSQGMIIDPKDVEHIINVAYVDEEEDLAAILGITKYEPPVPGFSNTIGKDKQRNKKQDNLYFHKYNGLSNIKWFPNLFEDGEQVVIQEKLHGTNCRAALLPYIPRTLWGKFLTLIKMTPKVEKCYGSNNVEISSKFTYKGYYGEDIYGTTLAKIDVFSKLKLGETIFGEIVGPSIQKNYDYGLKEKEFVLFDVKVLEEDGKQRWLSPDEVEAFAKERGFKFVPVLYKGPYNKDFTYNLTKGPSVFGPQKVREGIVIKAKDEYSKEGNKKALKWINEQYLDEDNTDFH